MKVLLPVILWLFTIGFIVMLHALRSKIIDFENNCHEAMSRYEQEVSLGCDVTVEKIININGGKGMNKGRRAAILEVVSNLESLKNKVESIMEDEIDYMDNIPENLQGSYKYEKAEDAVDSLGDAVSELETAIEAIENASKNLDDAL